MVIMTNGHEHDFQAEVQVRRGDGLCGRHRLPEKNGLCEPAPAGGGHSEREDRLCPTPVGTAIKAVTPEEIAVSIAGEMICPRDAAGSGGEVHHGCPMH